MINIRKRKGISSIIGSMTSLLIVTSFSSILLFITLNNINIFNITLSEERQNMTSRLNPIIIEHVRLNTVDNSITIWIRNLGDEIRKIDSISIFNLSEQNIVYHREGINTNIIPRQLTMLTYNNLNVLNNTSIYKIVIRLDDGTSIMTVINR
jgi:hypothetical protein